MSAVSSSPPDIYSNAATVSSTSRNGLDLLGKEKCFLAHMKTEMFSYQTDKQRSIILHPNELASTTTLVWTVFVETIAKSQIRSSLIKFLKFPLLLN